MNISRQAGFLLSTAICMDVFLTGGTASLAGTGIAAILQSLPNVGGNVLCGLATNHLSKEPKLNKQLEEAFQKTISKTIESVKNDFIEKNSFKTDWWRLKSIEYGFSIPDLNENYTLNKSLEEHFFLPLEKALQNEKRIKKILEANQQLDPAALIEKVLESEAIYLPEFRKEHEEGVRKALIDGFRDRFRFHLLQNLHNSEPARKAYQTQLLENSVTYLGKIGQNVESLLDIVNLLEAKLTSIEKSVLESREKASAEFLGLRNEILEQWALKLTRNQVRKTDIRDQFSFKSLYTTFQGRYHAIETLTDFLMDERKFLFYAISGLGGAGKSRLANEICLRAGEIRWIAGFSDQDKNQHFDWESFKPRAATLVVLDYVKSEKEKVGSILETLASLAEQDKFEYKVRVILLEREFDKDLRQSLFNTKTRSHYFSYVLNEEEKPYDLSELEEEARWEIIKQVISESDEQEILASIIARKQEILTELDKQDPEKRPLFAFFTAVALREGEDITGWNTNDNLSYHLNRLESKVWGQNKLWADEKLRSPLKNMIWLAAILEYLSFEDIEKIRENSLFKKLADQWEDALFWEQLESLFKLDGSKDQQDGIPGLKPDLLAEFFICKHITNLQAMPILKTQLFSLYDLAWQIAPERVWWMSWLTFSNYSERETKSLSHYIQWLKNDCEHNSLHLGTLFFNLAILYKEQGKADQAEEYYLKAIAQGYVGALNNLALLYKEKGKADQAEEYYLKAIAQGDVGALNNLAILYQEQGKADQAEEYYLKAIAQGHVGALFNLALLYQEQGEADQAEAYYLKAIAQGHVEALYNLALLYQEQGKADQAEEYYLKAIAQGHVGALFNLALLYQEQGEADQAEAYYLKAIAQGHVEALFNLALLYQEQGKADQAEEYYLKAIAQGDVGALNNLALLYQEQGKADQAEEYYLKAIAQGYVGALNNLANLYKEQGKADQAEEYYLKAIAKGRVGALFNLALLYQEQGKADQAEEYYLKAIAQGDVGALVNLALLYQNQGKADQAEEYYLKAIAQGHVEALYNLALLYKEQGKADQAEEYYLKAIAQGYVGALNNLANLYKEQGKADQAEEYYLKAIAQGDVGALFNLAILYKEQGKADQAEEYYLKAIAQGHVGALVNLALLYQEQGKADQAEAYYLKAIAQGHVGALFNLAILYQEQGEADQAEAYYLKAIAQGDVGALLNLTILFWQFNKQKEKSWELISLHADTDQGKTLKSKISRLVISAWIGLPFYPENRVKLFYEVFEKQPELVHLCFLFLYHDHTDFLLREFENGNYSSFLQENHPVYYLIVLHFNRPDDPRLLDISADLKESFDEKVSAILEKRKFYGKED